MITKYIYFPNGQEIRMTKGFPVIVWSFDLFSDGTKFYIKASTDEESAKRASGKFLLASRAVIFNSKLWEECLVHIEKRRQLEQEYKELYKMRNKIK